MRLSTLALVTLCIVLLLGCGTAVGFMPLNAPPRALVAKTPEQVEVLTAGPPSRPYVEVGLLQAEQASEFSQDGNSDMIVALRKQAAKIGCDAVVITSATQDTETEFLSDTVDTIHGFLAACIVYTGGCAGSQLASHSTIAKPTR